MSKPTIKSGKFSFGAYLQCGENVTVNVAEELVVGDRCVIPDNAYFEGRRVEIGNDFFGYAHWNRRLEVGRGRIDEEDAILTVGDRCTFHNNRIDLARRVSVHNDVGLSPEVAIYTHFYWQSVLDGYPCKHEPVKIRDGVLIGFRSVILPGADIGERAVVGAQSVVIGKLACGAVYAGNPAERIRWIGSLSKEESDQRFLDLMKEYERSCKYRGLPEPKVAPSDSGVAFVGGCWLDCRKLTVRGEENELTDDFRWFLFTRGIRIYTQRAFKKLGRAKA